MSVTDVENPELKSGAQIARRLERRRLLKRIGLVAAGTLGTGTLALLFFLAPVLWDAPDRMIEAVPAMEETTRVFDRSGSLIYEFHDKQRTSVPLSAMAPDLLHAITATEDRNFYRHHGVNPLSLARAAWVNFRSGRVRQGGSTLTQQLARMTFLSPERTLARKLIELRLALKIERAFTKDQILELYANRVYLGAGFYGVEAAAKGYFGRPASELELDQAAMLAGMAQAPTVYSPYTNPKLAVRRRNTVLESMVDAGFIGRPQAEAVKSRPLEVRPRARELRKASYAIDYLRDLLVDDLGTERTFNGGLRVYTTLDSRMQAAAERAVETQLAALEKQQRELRSVSRAQYLRIRAAEAGAAAGDAEPSYLQGALLSMNAHTGEIYAIVGGRSFEESQFNRAVRARRQPGSAFKPFVYTAALRMGMLPSSRISADPLSFDTPAGPYRVANSEGDEYGTVSLRVALRKSINTAAVALSQEVGLQNVVQSARSFGIESPLYQVVSLPLGACEVTLLEMVRAYSTFPNRGSWVQPMLITRVEDRRGNLLRENRPSVRHVLDAETAFLMTTMLADAVDRGTGSGVRAGGFRGPVGGKTGTTDDFRDAWFIGFTPDVVTGVWVGFDTPRTIMARGYGGTIAVPIWTSFMKEAAQPAKPGAAFAVPQGIVKVTICPESALRATPACHSIDHEGKFVDPYPEYFPGDRVPPVCTMHSDPSSTSLLDRTSWMPSAHP
jgi:penicillin-binding protein 1A